MAMGNEAVVRHIISAIGDDPKREGLVETPSRVVKSWKELFSGYALDPLEILEKDFDADGYDQMIVLRDIEFFSTCEHHMLPFFGRAHIAYLPSERVVGISKMARLVECFARRLQIQERLTREIADALDDGLRPKGVGVVIEAKHLCMVARGVGKQQAVMSTSALVGAFREDGKVREEFLQLIGRTK